MKVLAKVLLILNSRLFIIEKRTARQELENHFFFKNENKLRSWSNLAKLFILIYPVNILNTLNGACKEAYYIGPSRCVVSEQLI